MDAIVSLGTSTTLLMVTPTYRPSLEYHLFNHPTTAGLYMFMLCYINGALARKGIRDSLNKALCLADPATAWEAFDQAALSSPAAGRPSAADPAKIGIYFPLPEIIPSVRAGIWRFAYHKDGRLVRTDAGWNIPRDDVRALLESQALSMRLRSERLLPPDREANGGRAQPRRLYVVGGGSTNPAIASVMAGVLGGFEGVYRLDIGSNAGALGAAYYAAWALERTQGDAEPFEDFVAQRWDEEKHVQRIGDAYREGVWEEYGQVLEGFRLAEEEIVRIARS